MRGKEGDLVPIYLDEGITPACAGKSTGCCKFSSRNQDHPRMCGEKYSVVSAQNVESGSPPHVRGKASERFVPVFTPGITPACAGKSDAAFLPAPFAEDHPRMCGEKKRGTGKCLSIAGSPPHVRGKEEQQKRKSACNGITPACAGKRLKRSRSTVPPVAIVPLFPSVCNKPVASDGSPAGRDAPLFLPAENAVPASPAYNLRSL